MRILAAALLPLALVAAAPLPASAPAPAPASAPASPDWSRTVTTAPNGAYVIGNPNAKVRLVEYLSYTCSHCARYAGDSAAKLKAGPIKAGAVAVELRNAVRDRVDFAAALAARCGGPQSFAGHHEALFAGFESIMTKMEAYEATSPAKVADPNEGVKVVARASGIADIMAGRGVTGAALDTCLTDKAAQTAVLGMTNEAWQVRRIAGTPSFLINGKPAEPGGWLQLEPQLRAAIAARPTPSKRRTAG